MKDVAWLRYASGRCLATFDPEISEWGNLFCEEQNVLPQGNSHTQGSETSQYLEEKRTIVYFLSSGERKGKSPNQPFARMNWGSKVAT
jgi:hypothetical protein